MAKYAPNGTLIEALGNEEGKKPDCPEDCSHGKPESGNEHRGSGIESSNWDTSDPLNLTSQLVAALCDAGMGAKPKCCHKQRFHTGYLGGGTPPYSEDSDSDEGKAKLQVKIPSPIFKVLPGERPETHLLAVEDWMEVLHFHLD